MKVYDAEVMDKVPRKIVKEEKFAMCASNNFLGVVT